MGKKLGNDYRLWIESAVAGTYNEIKGQTSLKINRQAGSIDTSTKDDYPYGTQAPGLKTLTIDAEVYPNLPDANGYTRLETLSKGSAPVKFQIRKGGSAGAACSCFFFLRGADAFFFRVFFGAASSFPVALNRTR